MTERQSGGRRRTENRVGQDDPRSPRARPPRRQKATGVRLFLDFPNWLRMTVWTDRLGRFKGERR